MKSKLFLIALCVPIFFGCQKQDLETSSAKTMEQAGATVVKAASGKLYSISCLREHADEVQQQGEAAIGQCEVNPSTGEGRGFFGSHRNYYVYWPPTYYAPLHSTPSSTYTYYTDGNSSNNNNNNSSTVTYSTTYSPFWSYVFGRPSTYYYYGVFGYSPGYSTYYSSNCGNSCMYSYNPNKCQNKCWNGYNWSW